MRYTFETARLSLRPFAMEDAPLLQTLCGDSEIARTTLLIPHPYPVGAAESWIISSLEAASYGTRYAFAITDIIHSDLYGCISLNLDKLHMRAELAYWIGKDYWGQGYATESAKRIIQFGFDALKLQRIWAAAMTKNPASLKIMQKVGMQYEGTFRQHILKWQQYEDISFYGIIKTDLNCE
jgi:ribosomal-protein-alanine N-acetyltransferase